MITLLGTGENGSRITTTSVKPSTELLPARGGPIGSIPGQPTGFQKHESSFGTSAKIPADLVVVVEISKDAPLNNSLDR